MNTPRSHQTPADPQAGFASVLYLIAAVVAVVLIYNQPLWQPYLFADEMNILDPEFADSAYSTNLLESLYFWTKVAGRPVSAPVTMLLPMAFSVGESGLMVLRALALVASLGGMCAVFFLLRKLRVPPLHAALLCVFIWSQPAIAVHHAYLLLLPYWIGFYCAFASFAVFHARRDTPLRRPEIAGHVALIGIALLTFQPTPFVLLSFLALMAIGDSAGQYTKRITQLFGTLLATVLAYTACFKLGSMVSGLGSYRKARDLMSTDGLDTFAGSGYLRIFEFWNYPLPLELTAGQKDALNLLVLAVVIGVCLMAIRLQARGSSLVLRRWLLVAAMFGASLMPIVAESGGERQHMAVAAAMTWILILYGSGAVVFGAVPALRTGAGQIALRYGMILLVGIIALGASAGLSRAVIDPFGQYLRGAQLALAEGAGEDAVILLPPEHRHDIVCSQEPCTGFFGRRVPSAGYLKRDGIYLFAALSAGVAAPQDILIVEPGETPPTTNDARKVDWDEIFDAAAQ